MMSAPLALETLFDAAGGRSIPRLASPEAVAAFNRLRELLTPEVLRVLNELDRQVMKWGGPTHDDQHSPNDWHALIRDYNGWARTMAGMGSLEKAEYRWIQVAALAICAAATSRRHRTGEAHP